MGLYYTYGIEYGIRLANGGYQTLIPVHKFDDRLLRSAYYGHRKAIYATAREPWIEPAAAPDIALSEEEIVRIAEAVRGKEGEHGFFDVCYFGSSY